MKHLQRKEITFITPNIFSDEDSIAYKMKKINPKLFGLFCPVKYELLSQDKVLVPYMFMVFDYSLKRGVKAAKLFDRQGEIAVVYDMNENHAFHFDLFDDLDLKKLETGNLHGHMIPDSCTEDEAINESIDCIKDQYLRKVFHAIPEITLKKKERFYREAWRLTLSCHGKEYEKFAYKDKFQLENEHISGLKVRLEV